MLRQAKIWRFLLVIVLYSTVRAQSFRNPELQSSHLYICDGRAKSLSCDAGNVIFIDYAFYGRTQRTICTNSKRKSVFKACSSHLSFSKIWKSCNGKRSCVIIASKNSFGDPCPGVEGYVYARYRCAPPGSSTFGSCADDSWGTWVNTDSPRGSGDFELFVNHKRRNNVGCEKPSAMEIRLKSGESYDKGGDAIKVGYMYGATCVNRQQEDGTCEDYKIRYCCETEKPVNCPRPPAPQNGNLSPANTELFPVGTELRYSCLKGYELKGEANPVCSESSSWSSEPPTCVKTIIDESMYCFSTSFPHFHTFDGERYKFGGVCTYLLAKSRAKTRIEPFYIEIRSERSAAEEWRRTLTIRLYGNQIVLDKDRRVLIDGVAVRLPFSVRSKFDVTVSGRFVLLETSSKLQIWHDGQEYIAIGLPQEYKDKVEGLCGNFNGDASDDFAVQGGQIVLSDANALGSHHMLPAEKSCNAAKDWVNNEFSECADSENLSKYRQDCSIITNKRGPLSSCSSENAEAYFRDCRYNMCIGKGSKRALEKAVAAYANRCQTSGRSVGEWRNALNKEMTCGPNASYNSCGSRCPNTCVDSTSRQKCSNECVEGCECNEGYVLSDLECVPMSECGCNFEGKYYKNKKIFFTWSCTRKCECKNGVILCERHLCAKTDNCGKNNNGHEQCIPEAARACRAWGAPSYVTFDGNGWYDFVGRCEYVMSETYALPTSDPRWFAVHAKSDSRVGNNRYLYLQSVQVLIQSPGRKTIVLYANGTVTVNGNEIMEAQTNEFTISRSGSSNIVSTPHGLTVSFSGGVTHIKLSPNYKEQVRGICGNYNGLPADDLQLSPQQTRGTAEQDQFPLSFQLGSCQSDSGPSYVCPPENLDMWKSKDYCGALNDPEGYFKACHSLVDPEMFTEKCLFDICVNDGDKVVLAKAIKEYVDACKSEGLNLCDWRSIAKLTQLECPSHSFYQGCAPTCQDTCFKPEASKKCQEGTVEDCVCEPSYIQEGNRCITRRECGCTKDGLYIKKGAVLMDDQSKMECLCSGQDELVCSCEDGFHMVGNQCRDIDECEENRCHPDADCFNTIGSYICQCRRGKIGDGSTCRDPYCSKPPLPANANGILPNEDRYSIGSIITYSCELGYKLVGFSRRVCIQDNQWANKEPVCEKRAVCSRPKLIVNGAFKPEKLLYQVGERILYSCSDGARIKGSTMRRCQPTERWTGEEPFCQVECPTPIVPRHGLPTSTKKRFFVDDVVEYACEDGYVLSDLNFRTCLRNGSWAGPEPSCEEAKCSHPWILENGYYTPVDLLEWRVGSKLTYKCSEGYATALWKVIESICLPTRKWSRKPPKCHDIDECRTTICSDRRNSNSTTKECLKPMHDCHENADCHNRRGSYTCICKLGYSGDGREECSISVPCPIPQGFLNGKIDAAAVASAQTGEIIIYMCDDGYTLRNGDPVHTCMPDGKWSKKQPVCEDIDECEMNPCAEHASCTNTRGSYICFCERGYQGNGFSSCRECLSEDCGCTEDGISYEDGESFWNENCSRQCICEAGVMSCTPMRCEESQVCRETSDNKYRCEGENRCELRNRIVEATGCLDRFNITQTFNAGRCTASQCSERHDTCCGVAMENRESLLCNSPSGSTFPLTVYKVARCDCQRCLDSRTTLRVRAFGLDNSGRERPLAFGEVYRRDEYVANTGKDGKFAMYFDKGRHNISLLFQDNQGEFLSVEKTLDFKKEGGSIFVNVQIPMVARYPDEGDSDIGWTINLHGAAVLLKPFSFYMMSGAPYRGKIKYKSKYVNEEDHEVETIPGKFYSEDGELILFYDVLYTMLRGSRNEALMSLNTKISPSVNVKNYRKKNNLHLWKWDPDTHNWEQKDRFKFDREQQNLTCDYDMTSDDNFIAVARTVQLLCYIKIRGYKSESYKQSEQMEDLTVKGIYSKRKVWYTAVQDITVESTGACLPMPCDEEEYTAKFKVIVNGDITLHPDSSFSLLQKQMYGLRINANDNSIEMEFHPSKIEERGLFYESMTECQRAPISSSHLRFFMKSRHVSEFNTAAIDDFNILHTWFSTPLMWWPNPTSFKSCYIKVGIRGTFSIAEAKSFVGQRPDILGSLYGTRHDVSTGSDEIGAVCLEVKCSGSSLDAVSDTTAVEISMLGNCNRTLVNQKLKRLNRNVYLNQQSDKAYRLFLPLDNPGHEYGLYSHSSRDLLISKHTALRECYHGSGGISNVMIPDEGVSMVFECV